MRKNILYLGLLLILFTKSLVSYANTTNHNNVDQNIDIIFPAQKLEKMLAPMISQLMNSTNLTKIIKDPKIEKIFHNMILEYSKNFTKGMKESIKQNFTHEEIAEWANYQQSELGIKCGKWGESELQKILYSSMQEPFKKAMQEIENAINNKTKETQKKK